MPTSGRDTVRKDALYPDDLVGIDIEIDADRLNGEIAFWDALDEDDQRALPDGAKFGWWLPIVTQAHGAVWAACPKQLREQILELEPGDAFEVVGMARGQAEHDPYDVQIAIIER